MNNHIGIVTHVKGAKVTCQREAGMHCPQHRLDIGNHGSSNEGGNPKSSDRSSRTPSATMDLP